MGNMLVLLVSVILNHVIAKKYASLAKTRDKRSKYMLVKDTCISRIFKEQVPHIDIKFFFSIIKISLVLFPV